MTVDERSDALIHLQDLQKALDEWVIWQWANGDWHEIPGNWPTSEDALSEVKDLRDKNPETPFRFSKRNHVWG